MHYRHIYRYNLTVLGVGEIRVLTLSSLNLPLSSSSTTSRELLSQLSSGWRWLEEGGKWKKIMLSVNTSMKIYLLKPLHVVAGKFVFRDAIYFYDTSWGLNPLTAKLFNWNFHPLEVVSRWRDPQLQVSDNYSDLTRWRSTFFKSWLMSLFQMLVDVTFYL